MHNRNFHPSRKSFREGDAILCMGGENYVLISKHKQHAIRKLAEPKEDKFKNSVICIFSHKKSHFALVTKIRKPNKFFCD
jgi:hypothetical protein